MTSEHITLPKFIEDLGQFLKRAGDGLVRGSRAYEDLQGNRHDYFIAKVKYIAPSIFANLEVLGNEMKAVQYKMPPPSWLRRGDYVLIKKPRIKDGILTTERLWQVTVAYKEAVRTHGTIHKVVGPSYGYARSREGRDVLVHKKYMQADVELRVGARITYVEYLGDRGYYAEDIRLDTVSFARNGRIQG